ncbi:MAG TPA: OmpA family protein [Kofleriaceae bacterium]|jgi:hypothetical protein
MKKRLAGILLASAIAGCAPKHASFVQVDTVALGRVVVYRNGVAFYERRATVEGGVLTVTVPRERVDDFLKSLTVVDIATNKALPISIPRREQGDGTNLEINLQLPTKARTEVSLTYVTESPAWKPTYRVAVGNKGKVMLEGWAIVDNTSGEDWKGVLVGVGSSSALSFKYDLWSVRDVQRDTLHDQEQFAIAPPTGVTPYGGTAGKPEQPVVAELDDSEIRRPAGHPGQLENQYDVDGVAAGGGRGEIVSVQSSAPVIDEAPSAARNTHVGKKTTPTPAKAAPPPPPANPQVAQGDRKMKELSRSFAKSDKLVVIEGYADGNRDDAKNRANDRANIVRNELIDEGVAPARIQIVTHTEPGAAERVRLVTKDAPKTDAIKGSLTSNDIDAPPVGESHFANPMPMTVEKGSSAMVSMVRGETDGEVVYLYDSESERGNDHFAFRAVRFRNPTDSTLETGPVTVYGDERFIGEGLTEPIPPKSSAVVPYALDRQIVIDKNQNEEDKLSRLVTLERGVLTAEVQHIRHQKLTVTNRLPQVAKVYIRHTVQKGWSLVASPPQFERIGDAHLFEVDLKPGETRDVDIAEATPIQRTLDLTSNITMDMMKIYVESAIGTPELKSQLDKMLAIHKKLMDLAAEQDSLARRLGDYRQRMDELHDQIFTLTAVKTGGDLMSHLKDKMKDISERVQKATIAKVDGEEKIMLARVQFQDAIAELTLPDATQLTMQK